MALPLSGPISLNEIHIEAGGTSGTQAGINDSDIRGLISKGSGVQMSFSEWYGADNFYWEQPYTSNTLQPPSTTGDAWSEAKLGGYYDPDTYVTYQSSTDSIFLYVRSQSGANASMTLATYFGNQSGKSLTISGTHFGSGFARNSYVIVRGYATGWLTGASSDFIVNSGNAQPYSEAFTVDPAYPYLVVSYEGQTTTFSGTGYCKFIDFVIQ